MAGRTRISHPLPRFPFILVIAGAMSTFAIQISTGQGRTASSLRTNQTFDEGASQRLLDDLRSGSNTLSTLRMHFREQLAPSTATSVNSEMSKWMYKRESTLDAALKRRMAAKEALKKSEIAYEAGTGNADALLDADLRCWCADQAFAKECFDSISDPALPAFDQARAIAALRITESACKRSLKLWCQIESIEGGSPASRLALRARDRYFFLRGRAEEAYDDFQQLQFP